MSDYLINLAERAHGLAEVILPRQASRFEPLSFGGQAISGIWDGNNELKSSPPIFDDLQPVEERITPQPSAQHLAQSFAEPLAPRRTIDAPKGLIGESKAEFIPVSPIKKVPEDQPQYKETSQPEPPSHPSLHPPPEAVIQSREADLSAEKPPDISSEDKHLLDLKRNSSVENAANMGPPEQQNFTDLKGHEGVRTSITVKKEDQPRLMPLVKQVVSEQIVSVPLLKPVLVAQRNEKIPGPVGIEKDVKSSNIESQPRPVSNKITEPFTGIIPAQKKPAYLRQADPNTIESKLRRRSENNVHVTIGSIEVRATLPSVRAKNERKTPPVMSLDEYLQKRGGSR